MDRHYLVKIERQSDEGGHACGEDCPPELSVDSLLVKYHAELAVMKNKNGQTGSIFLDYIPQLSKFMDNDR